MLKLSFMFRCSISPSTEAWLKWLRVCTAVLIITCWGQKTWRIWQLEGPASTKVMIFRPHTQKERYIYTSLHTVAFLSRGPGMWVYGNSDQRKTCNRTRGGGALPNWVAMVTGMARHIRGRMRTDNHYNTTERRVKLGHRSGHSGNFTVYSINWNQSSKYAWSIIRSYI